MNNVIAIQHKRLLMVYLLHERLSDKIELIGRNDHLKMKSFVTFLILQLYVVQL